MHGSPPPPRDANGVGQVVLWGGLLVLVVVGLWLFARYAGNVSPLIDAAR